MDFLSSQYLISILQIIWIDILLSGDNAVVIALACRSLPAHQRKLGILLGAGTAVGLRIVFAIIVSYLLAVPFLKILGSILLLWIAVKLAVGEDEGEREIEASDSLWKAVRTIAIADAVMSFDNVVAIVGASHGDNWLFIFGLLLSIPLIVFGSTLIMALLHRFPVFVWAGAALLGWIAGEMAMSDPVILNWLAAQAPQYVVPYPADPAGLGIQTAAPLHYGAATAGALFVLACGFFLARNAGRGAAKTL
jgi:YjbE family integral membrane protein